MTFHLSENLCVITEAGIRSRHPNYNNKDIKKAWMRLTLGEKLFNEVFPGSEIEP